MKKPPLGPGEHCDFAKPSAPAVTSALDGLAHFHVAHSDNRHADVFTKTVTATAAGLAEGLPPSRDVCIVLASDPAVVAALIEALKPYLPTLAILTSPPPKPSIQ